MTPEVGFLLDVNNTLVGNDRIIVDLLRHLESEFGVANSHRYWAIFEGLREELGYADHLGALQRHRSDAERGTDDARLLLMSGFLVDHPPTASVRVPSSPKTSTTESAWRVVSKPD